MFKIIMTIYLEVNEMTKRKQQPDQRKARAKASGEQIPNPGEKGNASSGTQKIP